MLATFLRGSKSVATGIEYVGGYVESFFGTTSNVTITLTSLTGGLASSPAAGDLVIVYFGTGSTNNRNLVVSGYTEIIELNSDDNFNTNLVVARKFMGEPPDTSFTLTSGTVSASDAGAVGVQVWRGVDTTTIFDTSIEPNEVINSVIPDFNETTPVTPGAIILACAAGGHNAGTQTYSSSNLTAFMSVGRNDTNDVTIGLGYHVWTSGSFVVDPFSFSGIDSVAFSNASVVLALRPA